MNRTGERRMRTKLAVMAACGILLLMALTVDAHHSFAAEFDIKTPVKLRGTVSKMDWVNPHSWIHIDVKGTDGTIVSWLVEGGSPNTLLRLAFNKSSLPPGSEVVVEGFQAKDGSLRAVGQVI